MLMPVMVSIFDLVQLLVFFPKSYITKDLQIKYSAALIMESKLYHLYL